jgi:hypothetical protein
MIMNVYFGDDGGVRCAFLACPLGCGHLCKSDTRTGDAAAKLSVQNQMNLHLPKCPDNPDRKVSEIEKFLSDLTGD